MVSTLDIPSLDSFEPRPPIDFEGIINNTSSVPIFCRDFTRIFIDRVLYDQVIITPNSWAIMTASGGGYYTSWYLYNSIDGKLFIIWSNGKSSGFRYDIDRIIVI
jgi:hypothetical protein